MTDESMTDESLNLLQSVPEDADVYEATLAFDRALDAAPEDRTLLRRWAARFPAFEEDFLTVGFSRFALGLTLTDPLTDYDTGYDTGYEAEPEPVTRSALTSLASEAQARGLSLADLARSLRMDRTLLVRLEQRVLDAWTLPSALIDRLAQALERTSDEISAYLGGGQRLASGTHYRSRTAPRMLAERPAASRSFADAVRGSQQMSDEDKAFWLAEADKEGKGGDQ